MSPQRTALGTTLIAVVVVVVVIAAAIGYLSYTTVSSVRTTTTSTTSTIKNTISLRDFFLETNSTSPGYPSPYLSGEVFVNASVPWSSYVFYSNNTNCGTRNFPNSTVTQFAYQYKGRPCVPVTAGKTYLITFVVTFTDGTNASASASVKAG